MPQSTTKLKLLLPNIQRAPFGADWGLPEPHRYDPIDPAISCSPSQDLHWNFQPFMRCLQPSFEYLQPLGFVRKPLDFAFKSQYDALSQNNSTLSLLCLFNKSLLLMMYYLCNVEARAKHFSKPWEENLAEAKILTSIKVTITHNQIHYTNHMLQNFE